MPCDRSPIISHDSKQAQIKTEVVAITTLNITNGTVGPDFDTRMFGPNIGIPEDPVTGTLFGTGMSPETDIAHHYYTCRCSSLYTSSSIF